MSSKEHKEKIWNMVKPIKVGMLVTVDGEDMRARPMHLVQDDYDGTIWFFTRKSAEKSYEVKEEQSVCLTFCDHKQSTHVSLSGNARLNRNLDLIDKLWNPFVAAWFPDGRDDPDITLLEIKINKGEHWDATNSKVVQLFEIAKANVTDETPDMGENEKFG